MFCLTDRGEVHLDHFSLHAVNDKRAKKKGPSLNMMSAITKFFFTVKAALNCLTYAFFIVMARVNGDPKYKSYSNCTGS
jgi:hypothetical protein